MLITSAVIALSVIGLFAASLLSTAVRVYDIPVDPRISRVLSVLPGANCGACGNPSCVSAAERLIDGTMDVSACPAGGKRVAVALAELLEIDGCQVTVELPALHCGGGSAAARRFEYAGVLTCGAVAQVAGGNLACEAGCFGYGDCVSACTFGALALDGSRDLPVVDPVCCTGCGMCCRECPRGRDGLLRMVSERAHVVVRCISRTPVKARVKSCGACCTGCARCGEGVCPAGAIRIQASLAVVEHGVCTGCLACAVACSRRVIEPVGGSLP